MAMTAMAFADVFTSALRGAPCKVVGLHADDAPLPVHGWSRPASEVDRQVLRHCVGATIDIGCGPGRMSCHLASTGHVVLGIDLVAEAVTQARARGVSALRRSVFELLPGEGRWDTALLADGNIGIGGNPVALLRRVRQLIALDGRVVCDLADPGTGLRTRVAHLECVGERSRTFPWSLVAPEALADVAGRAGLVVEQVHHVEGRWFGVLTR
jgi:SAM-dependent methyltransferase